MDGGLLQPFPRLLLRIPVTPQFLSKRLIPSGVTLKNQMEKGEIDVYPICV
ncbi:hypothetical protein CYB_2321 [Synechococcus sp. JA-2-3B'a(2-13)]|nr:hypothetical protein CYB_2321 [Synechococcus sp. JA-2-3B'a(2-13)]